MTSCTTVNTVAQRTASEIVVTYQQLATDIGYEILKNGGNAFDAFVAATAVQYVTAPGVTSLSGPLGALIYDARSKKTIYLDATFNQAFDPRHRWDAKHPHFGAAVLVPGAIAGLEAISKKYGKLSFKEVLAPAIQIAQDGFLLNYEYAAILKSIYGQNLRRSPYALKTYFKNNQPLQQGDILKLPMVAQFLQKVASQGSRYVYSGDWMKQCIKAVSTEGGYLQVKDFQSYKARWIESVKINYRDYDIYSPQNYGGLNTLLSLKVLENADMTQFGSHYTQSEEGLAKLTLIYAEVMQQSWLNNNAKVEDAALIATKLSDSTAQDIWNDIQKNKTIAPKPSAGSHSYHIIVIDKEGNAITGTNTIESFPWANHIFVEGIPLTSAGSLSYMTARPGERRLNPFSMHLGFKNNQLRFASGAFSASLIPAEFQFIVNIIDYKFSARDTVSSPRFGSMAWDFSTGKSAEAYWIDPRISKSIVKNLNDKGLHFTQEGYFDTGLGAVAIIKNDGFLEGAIAPMNSIGQSAGRIDP